MKKLILIFAIVASLPAAAQINKGASLIAASTNLGYTSYTIKGQPNLNVFNMGLRGGYFVAKNFALGVNFGYLNINQSDSQSKDDLSVVEVGVFTRYYAGNVFFGAGFNSLHSTSTSSGSGFSSSTKSSGTSIPIELGYAAFITDNFAVEPSIRYTTASDQGITFSGLATTATSSFAVNVAFTLYIGRTKE